MSVSGDGTEPPEVRSVRRSWSSFPRPLKVGLGFGLAAGAKWKWAWVRNGTLLTRLRCQVDSKGKFGHREDASELERWSLEISRESRALGQEGALGASVPSPGVKRQLCRAPGPLGKMTSFYP